MAEYSDAQIASIVRALANGGKKLPPGNFAEVYHMLDADEKATASRLMAEKHSLGDLVSAMAESRGFGTVDAMITHDEKEYQASKRQNTRPAGEIIERYSKRGA